MERSLGAKSLSMLMLMMLLRGGILPLTSKLTAPLFRAVLTLLGMATPLQLSTQRLRRSFVVS